MDYLYGPAIIFLCIYPNELKTMSTQKPVYGWTYQLYQFSSVPSLSRVRLFVTPWITACEASLCITNSWSLLKLTSIELEMPSSHLILCCPLLLPSIFPSIRVFSNESALCIRWPNYWSLSFNKYFCILISQ